MKNAPSGERSTYQVMVTPGRGWEYNRGFDPADPAAWACRLLVSPTTVRSWSIHKYKLLLKKGDQLIFKFSRAKVGSPGVYVGAVVTHAPREASNGWFFKYRCDPVITRGLLANPIKPEIVRDLFGRSRGDSIVPLPRANRARLESLLAARPQIDRVLSTIATGSARLTAESIGGLLSPGSNLDVASAFFDQIFFGRLLRGRNLRRLRILVNGLGGARLVSQIEELKAIRKSARRSAREVQVRLAFCSGIFHSKLYLVRGRTNAAFVGSLNATRAALDDNEEILLKPKGDEGLAGYFEDAWGRAEDLDSLAMDRSARSLPAFFRQGTLFFKPSAQLAKTVNPFAALSRHLSPEQRRSLDRFRVQFAEARGLAAFSFSSALKVQDEEEAEEQVRTPAKISPYAIETCFGYWVPSAYLPKVQKAIVGARGSRRDQIHRFANAFFKADKPSLLESFRAYFADTERRLLEANIDWKRLLGVEAASRIRDEGSFHSAHALLQRRLRDKRFLDRLTLPLVPGPMPEIWDDPEAYTEFATSFFESVAFRSSRPGRGSRVVRSVAKFATAPDLDRDSIKDALKKALREKGWEDGDWEGSPSKRD